MGEDPRDVGTMTGENPTSEQLREDIAQTREELGDTAAALGAKTDVKSRAKERVDNLKSTVSDKKDHVAGKASDATPSGASDAATQVQAKVRANPTPSAAVGALLVGFALGRLSAKR
jgi:ElaB/YqjD/DUF883 family membrane-anchored ribosome-binding protein